jgi:hypothetical protein
VNEDLAAYSAKQKRQFLASLPTATPNNAKRIAPTTRVDNTQRCLGFQNAKISHKDIDDLYRAAAQQGDPARAGAHRHRGASTQATPAQRNRAAPQSARQPNDDLSRLIGLLETRDPEAMLIVGEFLAQRSRANLRVGPERRDAGALGLPRRLLAGGLRRGPRLQPSSTASRCMACAYGGYCNAQHFEELYQNFLASPWAYTQAMRYRSLIHTAIDNRNWSLIGLTPKLLDRDLIAR